MKYVFDDNGKLVPWSMVAGQRRAHAAMVRSELPAPSVIRDSLDYVKNPVDGMRYDSKKAYYQAVKAAGCEIVGNEAEKMVGRTPPRSNVGRDEVGNALHKVKQGYKPEIPFERIDENNPDSGAA